MYKTETHLHVSEVSPCAKLSGAEMAERYASAGYSTLFVSDHLKMGTTDSYEELPWEKKISRFLSGYEAVRTAGEKLGLCVLMSAELCFDGNPNHYLVYGIDEGFLSSLPAPCRMSAEAFYATAKAKGILVIQAHPYRDGVCYPTPEAVDGFEVINSNPRHCAFNEKAIETAREQHLFMTSGSDAHRIEDVGLAGVYSEEKIACAEAYIALVRSGRAQLIGGEGYDLAYQRSARQC